MTMSGIDLSPSRVPALDGLRAVAVLMVVLYHVAPDMVPAGLVGVDVFFVLSGYLITTGLLREWDSGSIHFGRFWLRRARRLLPALLGLVLIVGSALFVIGGDAGVGFGDQVLAGFLFVENWHLVSVGNDYFALNSPAVLQHLWSLAVEEQFYLVWPLALFLLLRLDSPRRALWILVLAGTSLLWGWVAIDVFSLPRAYYGTDTHLFGLLAGAGLAAARPRTRAWLGRQPAVTFVAVIGILLMGILVPADAAFRIASPVSVALTCLAITGLGRRGLATWILQVAPLEAIGRRSYGIYLWHWPALVIVQQVMPHDMPRWTVPSLALLLTVIASWTSYRFLELPVLRHGIRASISNFLDPDRTIRWMVRSAAVLVAAAATITASVLAPERTTTEELITAGQAAISTSAPSPAASTSESGHRAPLPGASSTSPRDVSVVAGEDILAIGDSVMLAAAPELLERFPGIEIDAEISRQPDSAPGLLRQLASNGQLRPVVVLGLGTNGLYPPGTLEEVREAIGPERRLVLVDVYAPRSWQDDVNDTLSAFSATDMNAVAVPWRATANAHPGALSDDLVHPTSYGARLYVACLERALPRTDT